MAKNFSCWVIVAGAQPTAFRARESEALLPTLKQLQRTQPDVSLMWFERGRFWTSPAAAQDAALVRRKTASTRGRDWRPGGKHKDPRARYEMTRDEKRARFKRRLISGGARPPAPGRGPKSSGPGRKGSK